MHPPLSHLRGAARFCPWLLDHLLQKYPENMAPFKKITVRRQQWAMVVSWRQK